MGRRGRKILTHWKTTPKFPPPRSKAWEAEARSPSEISASPTHSLVTSGDPPTPSGNFQAPLAHAGDSEMARTSYFPRLLYATRFTKDKNN